MAYQETTTRSYGFRLSGSFKQIGTGLLVFAAATALLFWNEGRAVKTAKTIKEAESVAVHVEDISKVDPALSGQLVHATGKAVSNDTLRDEMFGVKTAAIKLVRQVEYYQWEEHSKEEKREKFGGGEEIVKTYTYKKEWTEEPANSGEFHDPAYQSSNFVILAVEEEELVAEDVTFGAYKLPEFILKSINGMEPVECRIDSAQRVEMNRQIVERLQAMNKLPAQPAVNPANAPVANTQAAHPDSTQTVNPVSDPVVPQLPNYLNVEGNIVYIGRSSGAPAIGDVRITFKAVPSSDISLIAKVNGNTFERYLSKNGNDFSKVSMGMVSMDNMFQRAKNSNSNTSWFFRFIGLFLVITGLKMAFGFLSMLLKWLPALGSVLEMGVGFICSVIGVVWSLVIIAIAWLFYRPLLALLLLLVAGAGIFFLIKKSREKK